VARFWQLEMPFAAIGLIWNSIVSVAGGWFFLIACEMFPLGARSFRLPGLGSYLQTQPPPTRSIHTLCCGAWRSDPHHRGDRSVDLASAGRVERQIQI